MKPPRLRADAVLLETRRAMGWAHVDSLICPAGHHVPRNAFILTDGALRCKHRPPGEKRECGKLFYVLAAMPTRRDSDDDDDGDPSLLFLVEVTYPELQAMLGLKLTPLDVLRRLGATLTPDRKAPV